MVTRRAEGRRECFLYWWRGLEKSKQILTEMKVERSLPASGRRGLSSYLQYETKYRRRWALLGAKPTAGYLQSSSLYRPFSFNYVQSAYFFPRNVIKHHFCFLVFTDCIYFLGVERLVLRESDCAIMMFRAVNDLYLSIYTNPLLNEELMTHFWIILFFFYAFIFNNVLDRFHSALTLILFVRGIFADRAEYFTFLLGKFRIECASLQTSYGIWQVLHGFLYWHFKM